MTKPVKAINLADSSIAHRHECVLELPDNHERIIGEFAMSVITCTQQLSSHVHTFPNTSFVENDYKNKQFQEVGRLREAYNGIAAWNRFNGINERTHISSTEYWDFIRSINVFQKIFTLGDVPDDLSLTGFTAPPIVRPIRTAALRSIRIIEANFLDVLFVQVQERYMESKTQS